MAQSVLGGIGLLITGVPFVPVVLPGAYTLAGAWVEGEAEPPKEETLFGGS